MQIDIEPEELEIPHELRISVLDENHPMIGQIAAGFEAKKHPKHEFDEHPVIPLVLALSPPVQSYGPHTIEVFLEKKLEYSRRLWVQHPDEMGLPPR